MEKLTNKQIEVTAKEIKKWGDNFKIAVNALTKAVLIDRKLRKVKITKEEALRVAAKAARGILGQKDEGMYSNSKKKK